MALPFFYLPDYKPGQELLELEEETSKHIVQVLRMKKGELLQLTDGKGNLLTAEITEGHKKKTLVKVIDTKTNPPESKEITIAISLVKNTNRFEWFLEKATEIGVANIIPLICTRTEKTHFRYDRMNSILVSAMLQSQQSWLPKLHEPISFNKSMDSLSAAQKFIAHCLEENKRDLKEILQSNQPSQLTLIGPEGDFTGQEIQQALARQYTPVSLGPSRLRTETAGVVAAVLMKSSG